MRNKFPSTCWQCTKPIAIGEGYIERFKGVWATRCVPCTAHNRQRAGKPLSLAQAAALQPKEGEG